MFQRTIRSLALLSVAAVVSGACALEAAITQTDKFDIPFAFQLQNKHKPMPAGEYRIEQQFGSSLAVLVNIKTGERAQILRSDSIRSNGKARLVFETRNNVHSLRTII
jgi:hypothetical protein